MIRREMIIGSRSHLLDHPVRFDNRWFESELSALQQQVIGAGTTVEPAFVSKWFALEHNLLAAIHHIKSLVHAFIGVREQMERNASIEGFPAVKTTTVSYSTTAYFEFDAIVSNLRRTWDRLGAILWYSMNNRKPDSPSSFPDALARIKNLNLDFRTQLESAWSENGKQLRDYRDNVHHFGELHGGFWPASMSKDNNAWVASFRIPDNPEVKSNRKFTYRMHRDALTYSVEQLGVLFDLLTSACTEIAGQHRSET